MISAFLETQIINSIENSRKEAELKLKSSFKSPEDVLKNIINQNFENINSFNSYQHSSFKKPSVIYVDKVIIEKKEIKQKSKNNRTKSILGSSLIITGQPILKKRFIMAGSSTGTSIASKYLSTMLPQKLPIRILGTTVLGRAIGRIVPYVGWTLVAIDIIEIIIEYSEHNQELEKGFSYGFGGGGFSGGGSGCEW